MIQSKADMRPEGTAHCSNSPSFQHPGSPKNVPLDHKFVKQCVMPQKQKPNPPKAGCSAMLFSSLPGVFLSFVSYCVTSH